MKNQFNFSRNNLSKTIICLLLLFSFSVLAKEKRWEQTIVGSSITPGAAIYAFDSEINQPLTAYNKVTSDTYVELKIDDFVGPFFAYDFTVELLVSPVLDNGTTGTSYNTTLSIRNNRYGGLGNIADMVKHKINGRGASVTVTSVNVYNADTGTYSTTTPANVQLKVSYESERYYTFVPTTVPAISLNPPTPNINTTEIVITWPAITAAEEYEVAWSWVDCYADTNITAVLLKTAIPFTIEDFMSNCTRIQTKNTTYTIPMIYDNGYLVFRVRAIGRYSQDPTKKNYGNWNFPVGTPVTLNDWGNRVVRTYADAKPKNWQLQTSYAEDGKKKDVVSYFDGTLRNRQTVTKVNSNNRAIVGEVIYDDEGRPAVEVLPVPAESILKYYTDFNRNTANKLYSYHDFVPPVGQLCDFTALGMSKSTGASRYYSDSMGQYGTYQDFVPNAGLYPFSQIQYTPDNTGRISRKGGVGETHQLGKGHEMQYYYSTPKPEELNRLFGYNVGLATHYKKNTVSDPNGQMSVSYLDPQGRTVATALSNENPPNMVELDEEKSTTLHKPISTDLLKKTTATAVDTRFDSNEKFSTGYFGNLQDGLRYNGQQDLLFDSPTIYKFTYSLNKTNPFAYGCPQVSPTNTFNYPFVYKLKRTIKDNCGNVLANVSNNIGSYTVGANNTIVIGDAPTLSDILFENSVLEKGTYSISKVLTVDQEALEVFADNYIKKGKDSGCILGLQDPNPDTIPCFYTCEDCANHYKLMTFTMPNATVVTGKQAYVESMLASDLVYMELDDTSPTYEEEQLVFRARYEAEWEMLIKACLDPCREDGFSITNPPGDLTSMNCNNSLQELMNDMLPTGQYGVFRPDVDSEGNLVEGNNNLNIDQLPMSVYNDANEIFAFAEGIDPDKVGWRYPHFYDKDDSITSGFNEDYKHYFTTTGEIDYVFTRWNEGVFDPPIVLPGIDNPQPSDMPATSIVDSGEGLYKVEPQFLKNVEDFIKEIANHENWALSLVKYHPEFHYMDYVYTTCKGGMNSTPATYTINGSPTSVIFNPDGFDSFLSSLDTYDKAVTAIGDLKTSPLALFNRDPYFQNVHTKDGLTLQLGSSNIVEIVNNSLQFNFLEVKKSIMRNALTPTSPVDPNNPGKYESTGNILVHYIYRVMKCNGLNATCSPALPSSTPTFAQVIAVVDNFSQEDKNTFWKYYLSYYLGIKQKIQYAFMNTHAARQGFYNDCIGNEASENYNRIKNTVNKYPNQSNQIGAWATAPPTTLFSENRDLLKDKEKRFLPYDETYDSEKSEEDSYAALMAEANYSYLISTGNCPIISHLQMFLDNFMRDATTITQLKANTTAFYDFNGGYLTPILVNAIAGTSANYPTTPAFKMNWSVSGAVLSLNFNRGGMLLTPIKLTLPVMPSGVNWSTYGIAGSTGWKITEIEQLSEMGISGSLKNFSFVAKVHYNSNPDPTSYTEIVITGTTSAVLQCSINPQDATAAGVPLVVQEGDSCSKKSDFTNALRDLIINLKASGNLENANYDLLTNSVYTEGYLPEYFGTNPGVTYVRWRKMATNSYEIRIAVDPPLTDDITGNRRLRLNLNLSTLGASSSLGIGNLNATADAHSITMKSNVNGNVVVVTGQIYGSAIGQDGGSTTIIPDALRFACCKSKDLPIVQDRTIADYMEALKNFINDLLEYAENEADLSCLDTQSECYLDYNFNSGPAQEALSYYINPSLPTGLTISGNSQDGYDLGVGFFSNIDTGSASGLSFSVANLSKRVYKLSINDYYFTEYLDGQSESFTPYEMMNQPVLFTDGTESTLNLPTKFLKTFHSLPACPCLPQPVAAVSCDSKYPDYQVLALKYHLEPISRDTFCQKKYQYIIDGYSYYLDKMDIPETAESIFHPRFITLAEFGATDLNFGLNYLDDGYNTIIDRFHLYMTLQSPNDPYYPTYLASNSQYVKDGDPQYDYLTYEVVDTWREFAKLYIQMNVICPPAPMHTKYSYIKPVETQTPCIEFKIGVAVAYNNAAYEDYITALKNEFIKKYIKEAMEGAVEQFNMNYYDKEYQYTLYYYDQGGNLIQTVPPEGVRRMTGTLAQNNSINSYRQNNTTTENSSLLPAHTLKTQYQYNSLNQLTWQLTPDGGETRFAYDKLGRIIASQNAKQKAVLFTPSFNLQSGLVQEGNVAIFKESAKGWTGGNSSSLALLPASGSLQFLIEYQTATSTENKDIIVGLSYTNSGSVTNVRYGFYLNGNDTPPIIRLGETNALTLPMSIHPGDILKIERVGGKIRWFISNTLVYEVNELDSTQPMFIDFAMMNQNTRIIRLQAIRYDENKFSYTNYDALGRINEAGQVFKHPGNVEINDLGRLVYIQNGQEVSTENYPHNISSEQIEVTKTLYDTYGTLTADNFLTPQAVRNTRNRVTSILTFGTANASTPLSSYETAIFYNYDIHGNVEEMAQSLSPSVINLPAHPSGILKKVNYEYDLISGNVNKVVYQKNSPDQFIHKYNYDADNRIINVQTSKDNVIWETDAAYEYYDHGPLARTVIGDKKVQGIDYAYTLQGWLKTVNSENLATANKDMGKDGNYISKDAFGYSLSYFNNDYSPRSPGTNTAHSLSASNAAFQGVELYNGNINRMITSTRDVNEDILPTQVNLYRYDQLNRISSMTSKSVKESNGSYTNAKSYYSNYTYDKNGNLKTLNRAAPKIVGGIEQIPTMDSLTYTYTTGTNKLRHIKDLIPAAEFTNLDVDTQANDNYKYDEIGQLISDSAEKIRNIFWRVDGKVKSVEKTDGHFINFFYDGLGNRVAKQLVFGTTESATHYTRDAQGNVMGVYDFTKATTPIYDLKEHHIYGSSRLGVQSYGSTGASTNFVRLVGDKKYELSNHLGNVVSVINDKKIIDSDALLLYSETFDKNTGAWSAFGTGPVVSMMDKNLNVDAAGIGTGAGTVVGLNAGKAIAIQLAVKKEVPNFPMQFEIRNAATNTLFHSIPILESGVATTFIPPVTGSYRFTVTLMYNAVLRFHLDDFYVYNIPNIPTDYVAMFLPDVESYNDYYPFGMLVPSRHSNDDYRYGFQGQEKDNEIKGDGNSLNYTFRMHDPRVGRFFAVDPLFKEYPELTPYQFSSNSPIDMIELEGMEGGWFVKNGVAVYKSGPVLNAFDNEDAARKAANLGLKTPDDLKGFEESYQQFLARTPKIAKPQAELRSNDLEAQVNRFRHVNPGLAISRGILDGAQQAPGVVLPEIFLAKASDIYKGYKAFKQTKLAIKTAKALSKADDGAYQGMEFLDDGIGALKVPIKAQAPKISALKTREIIVDENLSPKIAEELKKAGYTIKTFEKGVLDDAIIEYAKNNNAVVLTNNIKDFRGKGINTISVSEKLKTKANVDRVVDGVKAIDTQFSSENLPINVSLTSGK